MFTIEKPRVKVARGYQLDVRDRVIHNLLNVSQTVSVMALSPNAGKTFIMTLICQHLIMKCGYKKIIILSENMSSLRVQNFNAMVGDIHESIKDKVHILTSWKDITKIKGTAIIHTLPTTIGNNIFPFQVDLLIIDEAHNRVEDERKEADNQISAIMKRNSIEKKVYATGTPSIFNLKNNTTKGTTRPYDCITYSMLDLYRESLQLGETWFSNTRFYVAASSVGRDQLKNIYNKDSEVKKDIDVTEEISEDIFNEAIVMLIKNQYDALLVRDPKLIHAEKREMFKQIHKLGKRVVAKLFGGVGKTIWACRNQDMAEYIGKTLNAMGVKTVISCERVDKDSLEVERFRTEPDLKCLVVVNRASLGFNMEDLENVIDLTGSRNIDRTYQLYSRITRTHPTIKVKNFYKVGFSGEVDITRAVVETALSLCGDNIKIYDRRNGLDLPIVRTKRERVGTTKDHPNTPTDTYVGECLETLSVLDWLDHTGDSNYEITAKTCLRDVLEMYGESKELPQEYYAYALEFAKCSGRAISGVKGSKEYKVARYIAGQVFNLTKDKTSCLGNLKSVSYSLLEEYESNLLKLGISRQIQDVSSRFEYAVNFMKTNLRCPSRSSTCTRERNVADSISSFMFQGKYPKLVEEYLSVRASLGLESTRMRPEDYIRYATEFTLRNSRTVSKNSKDATERKVALGLSKYRKLKEYQDYLKTLREVIPEKDLKQRIVNDFRQAFEVAERTGKLISMRDPDLSTRQLAWRVRDHIRKERDVECTKEYTLLLKGLGISMGIMSLKKKQSKKKQSKSST